MDAELSKLMSALSRGDISRIAKACSCDRTTVWRTLQSESMESLSVKQLEVVEAAVMCARKRYEKIHDVAKKINKLC